MEDSDTKYWYKLELEILATPERRDELAQHIVDMVCKGKHEGPCEERWGFMMIPPPLFSARSVDPKD